MDKETILVVDDNKEIVYSISELLRYEVLKAYDGMEALKMMGIIKLMVISGTNHFAGMTGFLPYGMSREEEIAMLEVGTCVPLIKMSIWEVIVLLNPSTIVLTGDLIDEETVNKVKEECSKDIPAEFMPEFKIAENFDTYYYEGMYQQAVSNKEF